MTKNKLSNQGSTLTLKKNDIVNSDVFSKNSLYQMEALIAV